MKFNITIANPPYNETMADGRIKTSSNINILHRMLLECYKHSDIVCAIFPGRHLFDPRFVQDFDLNNTIRYLYLNNRSEQIFNTIATMFKGVCYMIINKDNHNTSYILENDIYNNKHIYNKFNSISGGDTFNKIKNKIDGEIRIADKYKVINPRYINGCSGDLKYTLIIDKEDNNKYKIVQLKTTNESLDTYGVCINCINNSYRVNNVLQYHNICIIPPLTCASSSFICIHNIKTYYEALQVSDYLKSKWINFIIGYKRRTLNLNTEIIKELPLLLDINDNNYIEYFDLTDEDIYNINLYANDTYKIKINDFCK